MPLSMKLDDEPVDPAEMKQLCFEKFRDGSTLAFFTGLLESNGKTCSRVIEKCFFAVRELHAQHSAFVAGGGDLDAKFSELSTWDVQFDAVTWQSTKRFASSFSAMLEEIKEKSCRLKPGLGQRLGLKDFISVI